MSNVAGADRREEPPVAADGGALPLDRPWIWLEKGWRDFTRAPEIGVFYGFGLVAASWAMTLTLAVTGEIRLFLPFVGGFFILAPLLVAGLYDTSRRLALGIRPKLSTALMTCRAPRQLALMGVVLILIHLAWLCVALLLYALFFHGRGHSSETFLPELLGTSAGVALLASGTLIGAVFAVIAFSVSAVSLPLLVDRKVPVLAAIVASVRVVRNHPRTMLLWGALIVILIVLAMSTLFIGLVVIVPVVAHATWHAYRETLGGDRATPDGSAELDGWGV